MPGFRVDLRFLGARYGVDIRSISAMDTDARVLSRRAHSLQVFLVREPSEVTVVRG